MKRHGLKIFMHPENKPDLLCTIRRPDSSYACDMRMPWVRKNFNKPIGLFPPNSGKGMYIGLNDEKPSESGVIPADKLLTVGQFKTLMTNHVNKHLSALSPDAQPLSGKYFANDGGKTVVIDLDNGCAVCPDSDWTDAKIRPWGKHAHSTKTDPK